MAPGKGTASIPLTQHSLVRARCLTTLQGVSPGKPTLCVSENLPLSSHNFIIVIQDSDNDIQSHAEQDALAPGKPGRKKNPKSVSLPSTLPDAHFLQFSSSPKRPKSHSAARISSQKTAESAYGPTIPCLTEQLRSSRYVTSKRASSFFRALRMRHSPICELSSKVCNHVLAILTWTFKSPIPDLMTENLTLRNLLKSVSGFIADGSGGMIQKLGFELHEWTAFLDKSETDTAWQSFQARKHSHKTSQSSTAMSSMLGPQPTPSKRPLEDDPPSANQLKKSRTISSDTSVERPDSYHLLMPMSSSVPPPPHPPAPSIYPPTARSPQENIFSEVLRNGHTSSPVFMGPTSSGTTAHYPTPSTSSTYSSYMPPIGIGVDQGMNPLPYPPNKSGAITSQQRMLSTPQDDEPDDEEAALLELRDPKKIEAFKLIKYAAISQEDAVFA